MAKSIRRVSLCFVLAIALVFTMMPLALQPAKAAEATTLDMSSATTAELKVNVPTKLYFGGSTTYDNDYYFKIRPTKTGIITVSGSKLSGYVDLCNASKKVVSKDSKSYGSYFSADSSSPYQRTVCFGVNAGKTYYIHIKSLSAYDDYDMYQHLYIASATLKWTNSAVKGIKYGKTKKKAVVLKKNKTRKGVIKAGVTKHQWYKIKTSKKKIKISFYAKNNCGTIYARVHYRTYGSHGKWLKGRLFAMRGGSHYKDAGTITKYTKKKATYYVEVYPDYKASGAYTLKWK